MSARDDYPHVVALATTPREYEHVKRELNGALDEIDRLRAELDSALGYIRIQEGITS